MYLKLGTEKVSLVLVPKLKKTTTNLHLHFWSFLDWEVGYVTSMPPVLPVWMKKSSPWVGKGPAPALWLSLWQFWTSWSLLLCQWSIWRGLMPAWPTFWRAIPDPVVHKTKKVLHFVPSLAPLLSTTCYGITTNSLFPGVEAVFRSFSWVKVTIPECEGIPLQVHVLHS